jgi:hypothetical protein
MEGLQKNSPPFEKGRTGGIYEPPFQKTKLILIKDVSISREHKEDPLKRIMEAVEDGGCLPEHSSHMSEGELASFERMCKKPEKFLKGIVEESQQ